MNSKKAVAQLHALERMMRGKAPRLAAEQEEEWQILISTILSAQTRDTLTNQVSEALYKKYRSPRRLAAASLDDIITIIRAVNYHRSKARYIKETAGIISEKGIPDTVDELIKLPGVGRKTANVYLAEARNVPAIAVDTHVARISRKLAWTRHKDPSKIEKDLERLFPKRYWHSINRVLVSFGQTLRKEEDRLLERLTG